MSKMLVCTYKADDCAFTATCNGFQIFNADDGGSGVAQLNPYLIGKGNVLRFVFTRKGPDAKFSSGVREAEEGEMVNSLEDGDLAMPEGNELVHTFDSEQADLKEILDNAKPADAKAMLDFAMQYCDAIKAGDHDTLKKFNDYRISEAAKMFGLPKDAMTEQLLGMFEFFKPGVNIGRGDLEAIEICQGKVWEVKRKDGNPLLYIKEEDGSSSSSFIAAFLKDGPQVVR
ncbi:MAG: hypothetical protein KF696_08760 [Planctomycetes bacterium]|nr:hypothetical protein [Planctomycetota bacterium]MCW8136688.1 hypothetical protein [Planctomycetota bacterium]